MEISVHSKRRFVKDFMLPISVCDSPYFEYFLSLYQDVFATKTKYEMFVDLVNRLGGEEQFFQYSSKIQQEAIEKMKTMDSYKNFIEDTSDLFSGYKWTFNKIPKGQVYKSDSDGKRFFSIDIEKGNYSALRYYSMNIAKENDAYNNLILGSHSFDEFISNFTDEEYFKQAKKFRQVIFGNINPKRQQTIQKFIINNILNFVVYNKIFDINQLKDYTSDEIIFEGDISEENMQKLKQFTDYMNVNMHFEKFTIKRLPPQNIYVKKMDNGNVEFKCVENSIMPQVYKKYFNYELLENDLVFVSSNGQLAKYLKPLEFD